MSSPKLNKYTTKSSNRNIFRVLLLFQRKFQFNKVLWSEMMSKRKYFKVEFSLQGNLATTKMSEWEFHLLINLPCKIAIQLSKKRWICSKVSMMWWVRESPAILTPFLSVKAVKRKFMRSNHLLSDSMWKNKCKSFKLLVYKVSSQIE